MDDIIVGYVTGMDRFSQHGTGGVATILPTECSYANKLGAGTPMTLPLPEGAFKKVLIPFARQSEVLIRIVHEVVEYERKEPAPPHPKVD